MELSSHQYRRGTATQLLNIALGIDRQPVLELLGYGVPQNGKLKTYCQALFSADEPSPLFFSGFNLLGAVLIATGMTPFGIQSEDDPSDPDGFGWLAGSYVTGFIDDDRPMASDKVKVSPSGVLNDLLDLDRDAIAQIAGFRSPVGDRLSNAIGIAQAEGSINILNLLNAVLAADGRDRIIQQVINGELSGFR